VDAFINGIDFRFLPPTRAPQRYFAGIDHRLAKATLPLGLLNTRFPEGRALALMRRLRALARVQGLSTYPIAGIVNEAVRRLPDGQCYVNVGTWRGFTLFAGMVGNPTKRCVGIDNFSEFNVADADRQSFYRDFERFRGPAHEFHEIDYRDYFANVHREPIGLYLYDGAHDYDSQRDGLATAAPWFAKGCLIIIDDAFAEPAQRATREFMSSAESRYEIVLEQRVATKAHPTFWNGIWILRKVA
jgi:hypothetical protein